MQSVYQPAEPVTRAKVVSFLHDFFIMATSFIAKVALFSH